MIARWGDASRKVNMASVRKSLLSALYGSAIAEGRIDLSASLGALQDRVIRGVGPIPAQTRR